MRRLRHTLVSEPSAKAAVSCWDRRWACSRGHISKSSWWDLLARLSAYTHTHTHTHKTQGTLNVKYIRGLTLDAFVMLTVH